MTMTSPPADGTLVDAALLFRSLSDPARLSIVQLLVEGEQRVVDLTARLGLAQSTVSQHVACLRECGLLSSRSSGRATLYALAQPGLLELLSAAEGLLDATGRRVALCPTSGVEA